MLVVHSPRVEIFNPNKMKMTKIDDMQVTMDFSLGFCRILTMAWSRLVLFWEVPNPNLFRFPPKCRRTPSDRRRSTFCKNWTRVAGLFFRSHCSEFLPDTSVLKMESIMGDQPNDCLEEPIKHTQRE